MTATPSHRLLVVGRDVAAADALRRTLVLAHYDVEWCRDAADARSVLAAGAFSVVLLDRRSGDDLSPQLLRSEADALEPEYVVINASEGERAPMLFAGAGACIDAPIDPDELLLVVRRAAAQRAARRELVALRADRAVGAAAAVVGRSPVMQRTRELMARAALWRGPVVVTGEAGTGKQLVARGIHALSTGGAHDLVLFDCASSEGDDAEAALFEGNAGMPGLLAQASGGTLLILRAELLSPRVLVRLQRALDPRGAGERGGVPARLILTRRTVKGEAPAIAPEPAGWSRAMNIDLPALAERRSDIPMLAQHFRSAFARESGVEPSPIAGDQVARLVAAEWPDNVRQLERAVVHQLLAGMRTPSPAADAAPLPRPVRPEAPLPERALAEQWNLEQLERHYILRTLEQTGGNQSRAAQVLGIDRRTLYRKLREYGASARATLERKAAEREGTSRRLAS